HRADVIADADDLGSVHRARIDAVDDGTAVGTVLGDGHPEARAVVIEPTGMVDSALTEDEIGEAASGCVDPEEMTDALPGVAIATVDGRDVPRRPRPHLHRRHVELVTDLHHPLRVIRGKHHGDRAHGSPYRFARQL